MTDPNLAHPIPFAEANKVLGRPPGLTAEECTSLEVFTDGSYCVSRWQLSDDDMKQLYSNGGKLYVLVYSGASQPPIRVQAHSPFFDQAKAEALVAKFVSTLTYTDLHLLNCCVMDLLIVGTQGRDWPELLTVLEKLKAYPRADLAQTNKEQLRDLCRYVLEIKP